MPFFFLSDIEESAPIREKHSDIMGRALSRSFTAAIDNKYLFYYNEMS